MNVNGLEAYLNIDETQFESPSKEALSYYVAQFMKKVPFENIDVQNHIRISVDVDDIYDKVVKKERGGFCYELNTLFKTYLIEKGFHAYNVSATIHTPGGGRSLPGSHMSTIVEINGMKYIADVGFGDLPLQAIPLSKADAIAVVHDRTGTFRAMIQEEDPTQFKIQKRDDEEWETKYEADITPRPLSSFEYNIEYNQTNPNSIFVKRLVVTLPTKSGRITMSQNHLTITEKDQKHKIEVTSDNYKQLLKKYFNLEVNIHRLEK
ncbi:arylamine N-acetyltransferase [Staphylococcus hyicus]|uniref:Arylamine N-acetyltransferase n=1 Tax=Staphylococcus hyicus TaxID=1284 RepID=A0ACD5FQF2_STAHY|nr:arylamine N-acetyltransferase [Staphylococcus hyicus]MCQ9291839.1 arylamine N-acetyltransferase [Staphylococcus hyicus]MCQ9300781.1 arylamine N-acetyltransferase [Staphylococcus hyicus]MCQ9307080.1 arylamine N-acetyltransferase [Staphylococcus hyicus]MCQ9309214.1 arylamine N-acetyltransferase [Staphylococcus hyicus]MCQ9311914.1 arylamine N-acetyltransferase [Staphylococcus hyicus]